jgi:hypothetical protein
MGAVGIPLAGLLSEPIKIVQAPKLTMLLYEVDNLHRQIFTDGRKLPSEYNLPAYLGYSVGHWERDAFVVETAGFNDKTRLDNAGHPHSEALRITERFRRRDFGHLDVEITFDDPKTYTKPFTIKVPHDLQPYSDIFEMFCNGNEKDRRFGARGTTVRRRGSPDIGSQSDERFLSVPEVVHFCIARGPAHIALITSKFETAKWTVEASIIPHLSGPASRSADKPQIQRKILQAQQLGSLRDFTEGRCHLDSRGE